MRILVQGDVLTLMRIPQGAEVAHGHQLASGDGAGDKHGEVPKTAVGGVTVSCS